MDASKLKFCINVHFSHEAGLHRLSHLGERGVDYRGHEICVLSCPHSLMLKKVLRSSIRGKFRSSCFHQGLSPISEMAPVAMRKDYSYLDDWIIYAKSRKACLKARELALCLAKALGLLTDLDKSSLELSPRVTYLGKFPDTRSSSKLLINCQSIRILRRHTSQMLAVC